ncbi:MAG: SprB repeat-containing protein [Candidatus Pacebacteria bacterium]|nr:SprB repeat-containing protein [Candidatus Paceibacterota bacterium]
MDGEQIEWVKKFTSIPQTNRKIQNSFNMFNKSLFSILLSAFLILLGQSNATAQIGVQTTSTNCYGPCTGTVQITGLCPDFTGLFYWSDGFVSVNPYRDSLCAGHYSVYISADHCLCLTLQFDIWTNQPYLDLTQENIRCDKKGSAAVTQVYEAEYPVTYLWNGPNGFTATTANISNLAVPGLYGVTVTDANLCTAEGYVDVQNILTNINLNQNVTQPGCNSNLGNITVAPTGGTFPYSYSWQGSNGFTANTASISNLQVGTYTVIVTDANGCTKTGTFTIAPSVPPTVSAITTATTCGSANGKLAITTTPQSGTITVTGPNGWMQILQGPATLTGLSAGVYSVSFLANNGCTATTTAIITDSDAPVNEKVCHVFCNGGWVNGLWYNQTTTITNNLFTADGCPFVQEISIVVMNSGSDTMMINPCFGTNVKIGSQTYNTSTTVTVPTSGDCPGTFTWQIVFGLPPVALPADSMKVCGGMVDTTYSFTSIVDFDMDGCGDFIQQTDIRTQPWQFNLQLIDTDTTCGQFYKEHQLLGDLTVDNNTCIQTQEYSLLVIKPEVDSIKTDSVCTTQDQILWRGQMRNPGLHTDYDTNTCTHFILDLRVIQSQTLDSVINVCPGSSATFNGSQYIPGAYQIPVIGTNGCPATMHLSVQERQQPTKSVTLTVCPGELAWFNGQAFPPVSTAYEVIIPAEDSTDCDILAYVTVQNREQVSLFDTRHICAGQTATAYGHVLMPGVNEFTLPAATEEECDTLVKIEVFVDEPVNTTNTLRACAGEPLYVDGLPFYSDTTIIRPNGGLCGGNQTLILQFLPFTNDVYLTRKVCNPMMWDSVQIISDSLPCTGDTIVIYSPDQPAFTSLGSYSLCEGDSIWIAGAWRYVIFGELAHDYQENLFTTGGCDSLVTFTVVTKTAPSAYPNLCPTKCGDTFQTVTVSTTPGAMLWWDNSVFGNEDTVSVLPGIYGFEVIGSNGCTVRDSVTVGPLPTLPEVMLTFDSIPCDTFGKVYAHFGQLSVSFQWFFNGVEIPGADSASVAAPISGNYQVVVTNEGGCTASATVFVPMPYCPRPKLPCELLIVPDNGEHSIHITVTPDGFDQSEVESVDWVVFSPQDPQGSGQAGFSTSADFMIPVGHIDVDPETWFVQIKNIRVNGEDYEPESGSQTKFCVKFH